MWNDVSAGQTGQVTRHNNIARRLRAWNDVTDFANVQAAFDAGGLLMFPAGTYTGGALTITKPTRILAAPGAVLECESVTCSPAVGSYLRVSIGELRIVANGEYALRLQNCRADLHRTSLNGGSAAALQVDGGIDSHFVSVYAGDAPVGMHFKADGMTTTTQYLTGCTLNDNTDAALHIEAMNNSIIVRNTVFQSSGRGVVIDSGQQVTLADCYWENITSECLAAGQVADNEVQSLHVTNPIMIGGAGNDADTDLIILDRVRAALLGYGDLRVLKDNWLRTTANLGAATIYEPRTLGGSVGTAFDDTGRVIIHRQNGQLGLNRLSLGGIAELGSKYFSEPDDSYWSQGDMFAVYVPASAGYVKLAQMKADSTSGVKVTPNGIVLRSPDGSEWLLKVDNAGALSTEALP